MSRISHQDALVTAQAAYDAGDLDGCRELARRGLQDDPDDTGLLHLLGRADLEAGDDAEATFRRLVELRPEDAAAWRDLGLSQLHTGSATEAAASLRRAHGLDPDDAVALVNLAHLSYILGDRDEAVRLLEDVAERGPADAEPLRHLVDMYRAQGDLERALKTAEEAERRWPEDLRVVLDVAELQLERGDTAAAVAAFARVRRLDTEPGHAVYAYHGIIEAEARAQRWRRALDQAIEATSVDRHQLTTDLLATAATQLFGESEERPTPPWDEVLQQLAEERAEHRRLHDEPTT